MSSNPGQHARRYSRPSSVDSHDGTLEPPRPSFLPRTDRGSYSSQESAEPSSDSDREQPPSRSPPQTQGRHGRRRSSLMNQPAAAAVGGYEAVDVNDAPRSNATRRTSSGEAWNPTSLYQDGSVPSTPLPPNNTRAPPSAFAFPFQSYGGNPDPGTHVPGSRSRRSSLESLSRDGHNGITMQNRSPYHPVGNGTGSSQGHDQYQSTGELGQLEMGRPYAPFMGDTTGSASPLHSPGGSSNSLYRDSAAAGISGGSPSLPRNNSMTFRSPFLSPASRPSSSLWAPPSYVPHSPHGSPSASTTALGLAASGLALPPSKPPAPSTRLPAKLEKADKPWLSKTSGRERASWWITFIIMVIGLGGGAALCYFGWAGAMRIEDKDICLVMQDNFESGFNEDFWTPDVAVGGFGNGEFQLTTKSGNFDVKNGNLYIIPRLTEQQGIVESVSANGSSYSIPDGECTGQTDGLVGANGETINECAASVDGSKGKIIPPIASGRLNTKGKKSIKYGKVEIRAKLPSGDWLWPAVWMLPENAEGSETPLYGKWPLSGEIDIMEARGNSPQYEGQGNNYVRSSINYGPLLSLKRVVFGWFSTKRGSFANGFHTYTMEWTPEFMRFYTDSRLHKQLELTTKKSKDSWWSRGKFPETALDGSKSAVIVKNPWEGRPDSAPFDQKFHLIMNLAVGGTSGFFQDSLGNKPWFDADETAMKQFWDKKNDWFNTWPTDDNNLAFRIDSVKMWQLKGQGENCP